MHNTVVIKSNRAGMTVILDPDIPFPQLLSDIGKKFGDHAKFWGSVQMTLTLEGRELTPEEEFAIINQITENSNVEIICLVDTDINRTERCEKALNEKLMELSCQTGQFFKGNLQNGETLESEASIVIIGDVGKGAKVLAKGNVIVLESFPERYVQVWQATGERSLQPWKWLRPSCASQIAPQVWTEEASVWDGVR